MEVKELYGSIVALVTPFTGENHIDYEALDRLIAFHLSNGTNGILIGGTTGEAPSLSLEEFEEVLKHTVQKVRDKIPVIAGVGCNHTHAAISKAILAEQCEADAILVSTPYYNKPSDKGLKDYYISIANSITIPVIIYNVPGRTGREMSTSLILEIAQEAGNICGIKEASGSLEKIMDLIHSRPAGFKVFSGDDTLALGTVLLGGDGCISVVANQIPKVFSQMLAAGMNGEVELAQNLHYKYYDLMKLNFIESNPIPVKTSLYYMDLISLNFRSPMCKMEKENEEILVNTLNRLYVSRNSKEVILG